MMTVMVSVSPKLPSDGSDGGISKDIDESSKTFPHQDSGSQLPLMHSTGDAMFALSDVSSSHQSETSDSATVVHLTHGQDALCSSQALGNARTVTRGRRKSEDKTYKARAFGSGGKNGRQKGPKSSRDCDNSSSNGGNSGADGNGEDNDGSDDEDDDEYMEDDDDDEEDDDDDEEESKNEDDEEEESSSNGKVERNSNGIVMVKKESDGARQRMGKHKDAKQAEVSIRTVLHIVEPFASTGLLFSYTCIVLAVALAWQSDM